jgi:hypothetical protein
MSDVSVVCDGKRVSVPVLHLINKCRLFQANPALLAQPYKVRSRVSVANFEIFVGAIKGVGPEITEENIFDLYALCSEFTFSELSAKLSAFPLRNSFPDRDARQDIAALRNDAQRQERDFVALHREVSALRDEQELQSRDVQSLRTEMSNFFDQQRGFLRAALSRLEDEGAALRATIREQQREIEVLRLALGTVPVSQVTADLRKEITGLRFKVESSGRQFIPLDPLSGIIAHLTRRCGGNVHDRGVVQITSSGTYEEARWCAAMNAADLAVDSAFWSGHRWPGENISHSRNTWICYDFRDWKIIPTHYSIRSYCGGSVNSHNLKSWIVETSMDGFEWIEVDHKENNSDLNARNITRTFGIAKCNICRLIRLVNIGRNHANTDALVISCWEIFGLLME